MFFLPSNDSCSTQSLGRRGSWFCVRNKTWLLRIEATGGKTNLHEWKEKKMSISYPTLPDSQTFQILLVHRQALGSMWWEITPHVLRAQFLGIHPSAEERLQRAQHSSLWAIGRIMTETRTHTHPWEYDTPGWATFFTWRERDYSVTWHWWPHWLPQNLTFSPDSASRWKGYWENDTRHFAISLNSQKGERPLCLFTPCLLSR